MNILTAKEIYDLAVPVKESKIGLYFLFHKRNLMYVGQSIDIDRRITEHKKAGKLFDAFAVQECTVDELDLLESLYIHSFKPLCQGIIRKSRGAQLVSPISLANLQVRLIEHVKHPVVCAIYSDDQ